MESASSKMCVRTSRPITWMVPPWPRYVQACVDIKELPPGCNFDVVSYCCTTLHNPFCCKTQAGQGNLMRLHEGNLKCSLGKLYEWSNGSTIFNLYIILIFVICGQQPATAVLYLGSGCFSRQGIFRGFAGDRQNYCHSWCSRRTRSFESSLGCNTTTFKPSKTIQNTSKDQTFRTSWGSNLKKPCSSQRKTPWHLHAFHKRCLHTLGHWGPCYPGREWALWVSWMHRAVPHRDHGPCFRSPFFLVMK